MHPIMLISQELEKQSSFGTPCFSFSQLVSYTVWYNIPFYIENNLGIVVADSDTQTTTNLATYLIDLPACTPYRDPPNDLHHFELCVEPDLNLFLHWCDIILSLMLNLYYCKLLRLYFHLSVEFLHILFAFLAFSSISILMQNILLSALCFISSVSKFHYWKDHVYM